MKPIRIIAIADVILIGLDFVFMLVMLFLGRYNGFYVGGSVLVVLLFTEALPEKTGRT